MSWQIPSLLEIVQSSVTPKFWKNIDAEHQVLKTAKNTAELVQINRSLAATQAEVAVKLTHSHDAIATALVSNNSLLTGLRSDVVGVQRALALFALGTFERLDTLNNNIEDGFRLVSEQLRSCIEIQDEQTRQLGQISDLLAAPQEARLREMRAKADAMFQTCLRRPNDNQAANLQSCLDIYTSIVTDMFGRLDYLVWFQIGWLRWKLQNDLSGADIAFNEAQRLSDADNNLAFCAKSLRYRARIEYLSENASRALNTIRVSLTLDSHAHALHDAALYAGHSGEYRAMAEYLHSAFRKDPLLFIATYIDPEFQSISQLGSYVEAEVASQRGVVEIYLRDAMELSGEIGRFSNDMGVGPIAPLKSLEGMRQAANAAGYVELRQLEDDLAAWFSGVSEGICSTLDIRSKQLADNQQLTREENDRKQHEIDRDEARARSNYQHAMTLTFKTTKEPMASPRKFAVWWELLNVLNAGGCVTWPIILAGSGWLWYAFTKEVDSTMIGLAWTVATVLVVAFVVAHITKIAHRRLYAIRLLKRRKRRLSDTAKAKAQFDRALKAITRNRKSATETHRMRIEQNVAENQTLDYWRIRLARWMEVGGMRA